jgi:multisubunit Na+/H+ antiporter MnhC subunit
VIWDICLVIAIMFGTGSFLIMRKEWMQVVMGFALFSNGINLFLLMSAKAKDEQTLPIVEMAQQNSVDPLPQSLILTAIVIGFALVAFLVVLSWRVGQPTVYTSTLDKIKK